MKLFAWAIIGFCKLEGGNVRYGQYVYYSEAPDAETLQPHIDEAIKIKFPAADGWFETGYNVCEKK